LNLKKDYEKGKCSLDNLKVGKEDLEKKLEVLTKVKITNKKAEALRKRLVRYTRMKSLLFLPILILWSLPTTFPKGNYVPVLFQGNFLLATKRRQEQTGM